MIEVMFSLSIMSAISKPEKKAELESALGDLQESLQRVVDVAMQYGVVVAVDNAARTADQIVADSQSD